MTIRILADDLTGALDTAAAFACEVPVYLARPDVGGDDDAALVSVVATATRDVAASELEALLQPSVGWLRAGDIAFKKVDSLLRGNTFAECARLARDYTRVVFAPAYPQQGRVTVGGRALVRQPGATTAQPILDVPIAEAFAAAFAHAGCDVSSRVVDADRLWVPDAQSDADLDAVALRARDEHARGWLWCGSAGLALALARAFGNAAAATTDRDAPSALAMWAQAQGAGDVALVSATRNPVLLRQWSRLLEALRARGSVTGSGNSVRSRGIAVDHLAPTDVLSSEAAAAHLVQQAQAIVDRTPRPAALVVVGGDTLLALCRAAGVRRLVTRPSPQAGWGAATLAGGRWDGITCLSRSGAFGDDDDLVELLRPWLAAW